MVVAFAGAGPLAIEPIAGFVPGQVVDHSQVVAPENGSAMRHRQYASIHKACQRAGPGLAGSQPSLGPAHVSWVVQVQGVQAPSHHFLLLMLSLFRSKTGSPVAESRSRFSMARCRHGDRGVSRAEAPRGAEGCKGG